MNLTILSAARFLNRSKPGRDPRPEREEEIHLQERVAGPQPTHSGRRAAEILTERLAESGSVSHVAPIFIP